MKNFVHFKRKHIYHYYMAKHDTTSHQVYNYDGIATVQDRVISVSRLREIKSKIDPDNLICCSLSYLGRESLKSWVSRVISILRGRFDPETYYTSGSAL